MKDSGRKVFLKRTALLLAAVLVKPRFLLANKIQIDPDNDIAKSKFKFNDFAIIDLHCHPSMKMFLWHKKFWKAHLSVGKGENLFPMQENNHQFSFGNVRGVFATHYLLEATTEKEWMTLKAVFPYIKWIPFLNVKGKIEQESYHNFDQVSSMIDMLKDQIDITNQNQNDFKYAIVDCYANFKKYIDQPELKTIAIAHTIEGSHALGRGLPISPERLKLMYSKNPGMTALNKQSYNTMKAKPGQDPSQPYIDNLHKFKEKGVALITLSHFFRNDISYPVDGISPDQKKTPGMEWIFTPDKDHRLTHIGEKVVEEMLNIGMIVDLTHSAPGIRSQVFEMNSKRGDKKRPLTFTHTGAQQIYQYYDQGHYPYYKYYCVSDEEIRLISECEGVIGVIAENFWLVGADTNLKKEFPKKQFVNGISYMLETMKYINSKTITRKFDNIGIGTDFDGLADNPKDLYKNKQIADLILAMQGDPDFTPKCIQKITSVNAMRLLEKGWGNTCSPD